MVFMTQNPECHHQFVLFDGRPKDMPYNPVNQISFRLESLDTLKAYRKTLIAEGITQHRVTDHGNAWALYFQDPEGNPPGGWLPEERLTLDEALRLFTAEPAYAAFVEANRGRIAPGFVADLTVFDRDLVPDRALLATRAALTVVGGRIAYEAR